MKKSISKKLFLITAGFLILFISLTFLFQNIFFQKFYIKRKISNLESNLKDFSKVYKNLYGKGEETLSTIKNFEEKTSSKVGILNENGDISFVTTFNDERKDSNQIGAIRRIIRSWTTDSQNFFNLKVGTIKTYTLDTGEYDIKNLAVVTNIELKNNEKQVIFVVTSLQPVDEAVGFLREYYIYIYIFALIFIIILSFIYSNTISKPLKRLNKVASKFAVMDFSERCMEKSNDEIGNLSNTLNFLSENLNMSLESLKMTNVKLLEDIEKEKNLEKIRKEFVASASHELKTPISLISGYAEGIKDGIFEDKDRDYYIDVIIDEANKMSNMVSDMLELSKLESGAYTLKVETFFIDELLDELLKKFSGVFEKNGIELRKNYGKDIKVKGDRKKIEQVITNLITNAIKHTEKDCYIKIDVEKLNDCIKFSITNQGGFISEEDMVRIWDKFYKVDKARKRDEGGTGLGLSIVKNILELHKSTYGAENHKDGVKFYFTLEE